MHQCSYQYHWRGVCSGPSSNLSWRVIGCMLLFVLGIIFHRGGLTKSSTAASAFEQTVSNATLGFGKIFVLNMPSRTDHADWMRLSAAVSNLSIEFLDGVNGDDVLAKVMPFPPALNLGKGNIGSWRAHMNAVAHVVFNNISSALILEDDVDWDIRIKQQMTKFAQGTRALIQPLVGFQNQYSDPTVLDVRPRLPQHKHELLEDDSDHHDISDTDVPITKGPDTSPYGDGWDVLWLGHCLMRFPRTQDQVPKGRYLILNDETMIPTTNIITGDPKVFPQNYPEFTRVVHHAWDPLCSYAYAVSQRGARRILWEFGIKRFDLAFDNMMSDFCDMNTCLTVQPQLFSSFAAPGPVNRDSEINGFGQDKSADFRERGMSENIQRSVRLNMQAILDGFPISELEDQYPFE